MTRRMVSKLVDEGRYAVQVDVELIYADSGWSPYLSLEDASRLDAVREALRGNDMEAAAKLSRVFELVPLAA